MFIFVMIRFIIPYFVGCCLRFFVVLHFETVQSRSEEFVVVLSSSWEKTDVSLSSMKETTIESAASTKTEEETEILRIPPPHDTRSGLAWVGNGRSNSSSVVLGSKTPVASSVVAFASEFSKFDVVWAVPDSFFVLNCYDLVGE